MFTLRHSIAKLLGAATLAGSLTFSSLVHAEAPGGPDCGWGNLMFEGDSGPGAHFSAYFFNGSSGNAWIGMLMGTNGCSSEGELTYGGKSYLALKGFMDEVAVDIAQGEGEALDALSVVMGIEQNDRLAFNQLMHKNFERIFTDENLESDQVLENIHTVMNEDEHFRQYTS